jgi:hypothetical protein
MATKKATAKETTAVVTKSKVSKEDTVGYLFNGKTNEPISSHPDAETHEVRGWDTHPVNGGSIPIYHKIAKK